MIKVLFININTVYTIILTGIAAYILILTYTRIFGLRSFSKMSAGDFAMTVAVGSTFGSVVLNPNRSLGAAAVALFTLFSLQFLIALARRKIDWLSNLVDNSPILIMRDGKFLKANMKKSNITKNDLVAKLREANVLDYSEVRAVVFETTGDISVLHTGDSSQNLSPELLEGVRK